MVGEAQTLMLLKRMVVLDIIGVGFSKARGSPDRQSVLWFSRNVSQHEASIWQELVFMDHTHNPITNRENGIW